MLMSTPQPSTPTSTSAIVLFAHGSRDPLWHQPMLKVAARIQDIAPQSLVRCAYLELTSPDLPTTVQELSALGVTQVRIVPMFLGVGRHAREDLPQLVAQLRADHPHLHLDLQAAVGEDERLVHLLADMAVGHTTSDTA